MEILGEFDENDNITFTIMESKIIHRKYEIIQYTKMNNYKKAKKWANKS